MSRSEMITAHDGGRFSVYVASPTATRAPGVVLIQYICGVNRVMRSIADDFARKGFVVTVPDLFWRQQPGVELINDPSRPSPEEQNQALALNAGFDDENGVADLISVVDWMRANPQCSGKVGVLGYCLGGRLAYLMAARSDADCSIGYYGVNIDKYLAEADSIGRPLMLHVAACDELCSEESRRKILQTLGSKPAVVLHVYEGARHAFALAGGHNFDPAAAAQANQRSLQFLTRELRGAEHTAHAHGDAQ